MSRVAEFTPCLLQIVLDNVDLAVRQAGEWVCMGICYLCLDITHITMYTSYVI